MENGAGSVHELESKFIVSDAETLERLRVLFCAMSHNKLRDRVYDTRIHYFDTDDFALDRAGVVLRTMDAHPPMFPSEICIKTKGEVQNGNLVREEYVTETERDGLDLAAIDQPRARTLIAPAAGAPLCEHFNSRSERKDVCMGFQVRGKTVAIDVAFDKVTLTETATGDVLRQAYEVEVEFKDSKSSPDVTPAEALRTMNTVKAVLAAGAEMAPWFEGRGETGFRLLREKRAKSGLNAG